MAEEIIFNAGGKVQAAEEFLNRYDLKQIITIAVLKNKIQISMKNQELVIVISDGFEIGKKNAATYALYRLLVAAGFSETEAKTVLDAKKDMALFKKTTTNWKVSSCFSYIVLCIAFFPP